MAFKREVTCPNCHAGKAKLHCEVAACPPFYVCAICNHWTRFRKKGLKWHPDPSVRMYPTP